MEPPMIRSTDSKAPLRLHVPWRVHDVINKRTCLHIDAWLYQMPDDALYFVFRYSAGGHQLISSSTICVEPSGLYPVSMYIDPKVALTRRVDDAYARRNYPWLNGIHRDVIVPQLRTPREGYKGHVSVMLHYVWTNPNVSEPTQGLENLYAVHGKGQRELDHTPAQTHALAMLVPERWSGRDRSTLRTLGKLLRPVNK